LSVWDTFLSLITGLTFWLWLLGALLVCWVILLIFSHLLFLISGGKNPVSAVKWSALISAILFGALLISAYFFLNWSWVLLVSISVPIIIAVLLIILAPSP